MYIVLSDYSNSLQVLHECACILYSKSHHECAYIHYSKSKSGPVQLYLIEKHGHCSHRAQVGNRKPII